VTSSTTVAVVSENTDASPTTLTRAKSNVAQSRICTQIVLHGAGNVHAAGAPQATVDEPLSPLRRHASAMPPGPPTLNATTIILACTSETALIFRTARSTVVCTWNRLKTGTYAHTAQLRNSAMAWKSEAAYRRHTPPEGEGALVLADALGSSRARPPLWEEVDAANHRSEVCVRQRDWREKMAVRHLGVHVRACMQSIICTLNREILVLWCRLRCSLCAL
jgi:hypothetical protein